MQTHGRNRIAGPIHRITVRFNTSLAQTLREGGRLTILDVFSMRTDVFVDVWKSFCDLIGVQSIMFPRHSHQEYLVLHIKQKGVHSLCRR